MNHGNVFKGRFCVKQWVFLWFLTIEGFAMGGRPIAGRPSAEPSGGRRWERGHIPLPTVFKSCEWRTNRRFNSFFWRS